MTTIQQESVACEIGCCICTGLDKIKGQSHQSPDTIKLVQSIRPSGKAQMKGKDCLYHPNAQFRLRYPSMLKYPGVAIEVSWGQSWGGKEGLEKKMGDLMEVGGSTTRVVIGVMLSESASGDLNMSSSLWRLTTPDSSNALKVAWDRVWDRVEIVPGDEHILRLTLDDFISPDTAAKHFPGADLDAEVLIPLGCVYEDAKCAFELWQLENEEDQDKARV